MSGPRKVASVKDSMRRLAVSEVGSASIQVTVLEAPVEPTDVIVSSITYATKGGRFHDRNLLITPALVDGLGNPVSGASVTIWLISETVFAEGTAPTGADGTVEFVLRDAPSGTYTTIVINLVAAGYTWNGITPDNSFTK